MYSSFLKSHGSMHNTTDFEKVMTNCMILQELMETITSSELPPRGLTTSQRKRRLEEERRLPEEAVKRAETALRRGLWKKHLDNVR